MSHSRTLNPLHFEDLDPHRFEDLVRQLIYDFRDWRLLEPTGRLGSDDGYDARGFEIANEKVEEEEADEEEDGGELPRTTERLWQIQCKREKSIAPSKIVKYVDEMMPKGSDIPYGVIFAAPCDFSKRTRDTFAVKMREKKVQEFYLWGKADLEDMLVQPKNDNLLYAYFGISLVIRRRSLKTQIRSLLAIKRKTVRYLGTIEGRSRTEVLIRDAADSNYPYIGDIPDFKKLPRWKKYYFLGHTYDGIRILLRQHIAYKEIDEQTSELLKWDCSEEVNLALPHREPWNKPKDWDDKFYRAHAFLDTLNKPNQAFFELEGIVPYKHIIEIDPLGDPIAQCPHIYVEVKNGTWCDGTEAYLNSRDQYGVRLPLGKKHDGLKIKFFPKKLPDPAPLKPLPLMGSTKEVADQRKEEINPEFKKLAGDEEK